MIVLFVLFPIVMLERIFLSPWTAGLNPSLGMFIAHDQRCIGLLANGAFGNPYASLVALSSA